MAMNDIRPLAVGLEEAAGMLGIAPRTLRKFAAEKRVASIKAGGRLLFRPSALEDFLNRNERPVCGGAKGKAKGGQP